MDTFNEENKVQELITYCTEVAKKMDVICHTQPDIISIDENTVGIMDALRNPDSYKKMLENYTKEELDINIELPNYENLPKPLIEVFTVDSASCAACGYLKQSATRLYDTFDDKI